MAVKRQVIVGVASLAALYVSVSNALGLGELTLDSALNQPLSATIHLQGAEGLGPNDLLVTLARPEAFEQAGIERPFFLSDLRFTPVVENDQLLIRVESSRPVREPFLNFLVELRRPNGRMLREYTLLLDPPLYDPARAVAAQPENVRRPTSSSVTGQPLPTPGTAAGRPDPLADMPLPDLQAQPGAGQYQTIAGDTLWDIAAANRPDSSVPILRNMLAIRALNPGAFVGGDANRLRVGQTLTLPTAEQIGASPSEARGELLAGSVGTAPPVSEAPADAAAEAPVDAPTGRTEPTPALSDETLSAQAEGPATTDLEARLRIEESGVAAAEADAAELVGRLQALEARFTVLLSELDARDRQIASLQAELDILRQAKAADEGEAGQAGGTLGSGASGTGAASASGSETPAPGSISAEMPTSADASSESGSSIWSNWWAALLALVAFILGVLVTRMRSAGGRSERADDSDDYPPFDSSPVVAAAGTSLVARPVNTEVAAAKPAVDPLDGVELYITYGRFAEARTLLDKAIDAEPERLDLRFKQLRVLAELGDARGFEEDAEEVLELGGEPERIEQIKARFPDLFAEPGGGDLNQVERVEHLDPLFDGDVELKDQDAELEQDEQEPSGSQLNLNDFTLDPDWDLIDGLGPTPTHNKVSDKSADVVVEEDDFESSLHDLPDVEELDAEHDTHFNASSLDDDEPNRRDK